MHCLQWRNFWCSENTVLRWCGFLFRVMSHNEQMPICCWFFLFFLKKKKKSLGSNFFYQNIWASRSPFSYPFLNLSISTFLQNISFQGTAFTTHTPDPSCYLCNLGFLLQHKTYKPLRTRLSCVDDRSWFAWFPPWQPAPQYFCNKSKAVSSIPILSGCWNHGVMNKLTVKKACTP